MNAHEQMMKLERERVSASQRQFDAECAVYAKRQDRVQKATIVGSGVAFWATLIIAVVLLSGCGVSRDTAPMPPNAENPLCGQDLSEADRYALEAEESGEAKVLNTCQSPGEKAISKRFWSVLEKPVQ